MVTQTLADRPQTGVLLRQWRELRGKSQLDLSLDAGVSQRHISFIEVGRSTPSRQMLIDIATVLDMPLRDRNTLLLAGGYAPIYPDVAWDGPEMATVNRALARMLHQQEPFPALLMDRYWNVLMTNQATPLFFGQFCDLSARQSPRNMLEPPPDSGLTCALAIATATEQDSARLISNDKGRQLDSKRSSKPEHAGFDSSLDSSIRFLQYGQRVS